MTREEAIRELEILKDDYWDDDGYGHETKQYDDTMLALNMAIKSLEQESVLDKIKAEIENHCGLAKENHCRYCSYCNNLMGIREILEVIDKYKGESEE